MHEGTVSKQSIWKFRYKFENNFGLSR